MLDLNSVLDTQARETSNSASSIKQQIAELTAHHQMSQIYLDTLEDFGYGHREDGDVDFSINDADKETLISTASEYFQNLRNSASEQGQKFDYIKERPALTAVYFQMLDRILDRAIIQVMANAEYGDNDELPSDVADLEVQRTHLMGIWAQLEGAFIKRGLMIPDELRFENIGLTRVSGAIRDGVVRERRIGAARQRDIAAARERAGRTNTTLVKEFAKQRDSAKLDPEDPKYRQQALGVAIRAARLMLNLTQSEVADGNFSVSYISAVERGQIRPSLRALETLTRRLNVKEEELIALTDPNLNIERE